VCGSALFYMMNEVLVFGHNISREKLTFGNVWFLDITHTK
jgi:hypothetical protein